MINYAELWPEEEEKIKVRFLEECSKIIDKTPVVLDRKIKGVRALSLLLGDSKHQSLLSEIKSGRYKVNLKLIWIAKKFFPEFDVEYVVFGIHSISGLPGNDIDVVTIT